MSSPLGDILGSKRYDKPDEIELIKQFVVQRFGQAPTVYLKEQVIIIAVSSSSMAGALRPELHILQEQLKTTKRLVIRID